MKIEKIKKLNNGKYKLVLDNKQKIITYDDVIIKNNLLYHKDINSSVLNNINIDTNYYDIYNKCIKLISIKLKSEYEIERYLEKFNLSKKDADKIIKELKDINLINDLNYTKAFISDRLYLSNDGLNKIYRDLSNNGILENVIKDELDKIDNQIIIDKLNKLIIKKIKNNHKYSNYILKQKLVNDFIVLGYDKDLINIVIDNNLVGNDVIEKNYDLIYNKLNKKFTGDELYFKIRQKLYQKGFKIEEINNIINQKTEF